MAVYYGVVEDNRVILEGNVPLTNGQRVEVRVAARDDDEVVDEILRAEGLLDDQPLAPPSGPAVFAPIKVTGHPLSEQIIAERR